LGRFCWSFVQSPLGRSIDRRRGKGRDFDGYRILSPFFQGKDQKVPLVMEEGSQNLFLKVDELQVSVIL